MFLQVPRLRLALLLAVLLLPVLAQAQTPAFGERVGNELDAEERDYFGLFPQVEGFVSATGHLGRNDTLRVAFRTTGEPYGDLLIRPEEGHALRQFIVTFEQYPTAYLNPRWQIVRPFASPEVPVPYVDVERATVEVDAAGRRFPGIVLLASDTLLVLYPEATAYTWTADRALAIPTASITRVQPTALGRERNRTTILGLGALAGVGAGGGITGLTGDSFTSAQSLSTLAIGAMVGYAVADIFWPASSTAGTYAEHRARLGERAAFADRQPYDLPGLDARSTSAEGFPSSAAPASSGPPTRLQQWHRTYGWVSLGALGPGRISDQGETIVYDEFLINRMPEQVLPREGLRNSFDLTSGFDVSLRPIPWFRLGATWHQHDVPTLVLIDREETASIEPGRLRGYAEVILPSPRVRGFGVDLGLGLGRETNRLAVARETSGSGRPLPFSVEEERTGVFLQGTLELFATPRSSVFVRYTRRDIDPLAVDRVEERFPILNNPDDLFYYAEAHEVTFGYTEITWGTRFHF